MSEAVDQNVSILALNIWKGGYDEYNTPAETDPAREDAILDVITQSSDTDGTDTVCLSDAHQWREHYGSDLEIAEHLGFETAIFVPLDDERLNRDEGKGIGNVFATDQPVHTMEPLDLYNRQGIKAVLDVGKYGLQIATVYLDDLNENLRIVEIGAMMDDLERDIPTVLTGDFNMLRPNMRGASFSTRRRDVALRSLSAVLPVLARTPKLKDNPTVQVAYETIPDLNRREAHDILLAPPHGYKDGDAKKRQTFFALGGMVGFGVDYAFFNHGISGLENFKVFDTQGASDHRGISFTVPVIH